MAAKRGIHEPLLPPLYEVSDTIRGPYALLAAVIMIVLSGLVVAAKLHMTLATFRKLRANDLMTIVALAFAIGHSIAICKAVQYGLGSAASELTSFKMRALSQSYYASNILLFLSLGSSKSAVAMLVISLQPRRSFILCSYTLLAISIAWGLVAAVVVALQCSPRRWVIGPDGADTCIDQYGAQIALRTIDIVTDIALVILPAVLMVTVQTTRLKRFIVVSAFGVRLVTPIFTSISLVSLRTFYNTATADRPYKAVTPSIWTSVALNMSLITACVPSIRRLITDWAAGVVNAGIMEPFETQNSTIKSRSERSLNARVFRGSHPRVRDWSSSERKESAYSTYARRGEDNHVRVRSDGESETRLTDGILQTVDFRVDYSDK